MDKKQVDWDEIHLFKEINDNCMWYILNTLNYDVDVVHKIFIMPLSKRTPKIVNA